MILGFDPVLLNKPAKEFGKYSNAETMEVYFFRDPDGSYAPGHRQLERFGFPGAAKRGQGFGQHWVSFDSAVNNHGKVMLRELYEAVHLRRSPSLVRELIEYYNAVEASAFAQKEAMPTAVQKAFTGIKFARELHPALAAVFKEALANKDVFDDDAIRVLADFYKGRAAGVYEDLHLERLLARRGSEFPPAGTPGGLNLQ